MMSAAHLFRTAVATAAIACLALGGCKASEQATAAAEPPVEEPAAPVERADGEPIMLHARIDYANATDAHGVGSSNGSHFVLELRQPAFRSGEGATAEYAVDNDQPAQVVGTVHGFGRSHLVVDAGTLTERYDESARWTQPTAPAQGVFRLGMPRASDVGDGLTVELEVHAAVSGSKTAHLQSSEASAEVEPNFSVPPACGPNSEYLDDRGEACGFKLSLDATPVVAKSEAGKQLLPSLQQGLAAPNGEWVMAGLGNLYGATTLYRERGHFVLTYTRDLALAQDGGSLSQGYRIVVWSTGRSEDWKPADLPPLAKD